MRKRVRPLMAIAGLLLMPVRVTVAGNITWMSPSAGDVYASGDTIVGQWSADEAVSSPSFSLCASDSSDGDDGDNCGSEVWPVIGQSDGSYLIYLSLPNVSSVSQYYLRMEDESGSTTDSPSFSLSPTSPDPDSKNSTVPANSTATSIPLSSNAPELVPVLDESRMPSPTAAYAVPLSLVISVLLAAGGLCMHHQRKLKDERQQDEKALSQPSLSRQPSMDFTTLFDASIRSRSSTPASSRASSYRGSRDSHDRWDDSSWKSDRTFAYKGPPSLRRERRVTREPFYTDSGRRRQPARVPASVFRAAMSPVPPTQSKFSRSNSSGKAKESDEDEDYNASVEDSVVSRYFHPSPIPPSPAPPERLHVRKCADPDFDKPLPMNPGVEDRALYDEVARRLSGSRLQSSSRTSPGR
ncbi:hypothetical protein AcW1_000209 [Taiwanofungus camphoratus]|nr:hypothetical protein AcV7_000226 [Antrodia cinnamomea]KAI0963000.1 hypothetical protein AcW1_000209 [Antrodia cinnamomea]